MIGGTAEPRRLPYTAGIIHESIVAALAPLTGQRFVETLVARLTDVLGVAYAFVARRDRGNPAIARTLAVAHKGGPVGDLVYPLEGTPCGDVLAAGVCELTHAARTAYPADPSLDDMGVESYVGVLLACEHGRPLGWLAVMHTAPLRDTRRITDLLLAVSPRTAAELYRMDTDHVLQRTQSAMEQRVAERTAELESAHLALERAERMLREAGLEPPPRPAHANEVAIRLCR